MEKGAGKGNGKRGPLNLLDMAVRKIAALVVERAVRDVQLGYVSWDPYRRHKAITFLASEEDMRLYCDILDIEHRNIMEWLAKEGHLKWLEEEKVKNRQFAKVYGGE